MNSPRLLLGAYRVVLRMDPADFRRAVGPAMLADFSEGCDQSRRARGLAAGTQFTLRQLVDLLHNVGSEWRSPSGRRRQGLRVWLRALGQEMLFGARSLRRDPMFAATVVAVIGLSITAVVTVYGMVEAILLEPMPYPEPDRIVSIRETYRVTQRKSVA
jgi:hypothetical protein